MKFIINLNGGMILEMEDDQQEIAKYILDYYQGNIKYLKLSPYWCGHTLKFRLEKELKEVTAEEMVHIMNTMVDLMRQVLSEKKRIKNLLELKGD